MAVRFRRNAMGCDFELILEGLPEQALIDTSVEAWELLARLDGLLSHYKPKSEVSNINARAGDEPVLVSPEVFDLLLFARDMWGLTDQFLDITVSPLLRVWRSFTGDAGEPPSETVESVRKKIGFRHLLLDPERRLVKFSEPGVEISFAALGKGYALDRITELLRERGVPAAFLAAGSSSAYGYGKDEGWGIRITHPEDSQVEIARVALSEQGLSASGPSEQRLWVAGEYRSHLVNPRTAELSTSRVTATVIASTALEAEALSTAIAVSVPTISSSTGKDENLIWIPEWLQAYLNRAPDVLVWLVEPAQDFTKAVKLSGDSQGGSLRVENIIRS